MPQTTVTDAQGLARSQADELAAWRDMVRAAPADWAQAHGLSWAEREGALALGLRDLPVGMFNRAFGLGGAAALTPAELDWAHAAVPHHAPWLQPTPGPFENDSLAVLEREGYAQLPMRWAKLACPLTGGPIATPAGALTVRELDAGEGALFGRTVQGAMGLPPWMADWSPQLAGRPGWHLYVACDTQGEAVGCAAMFMTGDSAWLGMAATHPAARNQGGQRALMLRRLRDAQQWGAVTATTETGEPVPGQPSPSFHNMLACGFTVCALRTNWKRG